jgi:hypothetical protein
MYLIDKDECPTEASGNYRTFNRAGRHEDCLTDVMHNLRSYH